MIYYKSRINDPNKGGMVEFKFQQAYKSQLVIHRTNCGILRINLLRYPIGMDPSNLRVRPVFVIVPNEMQDLRDSVMLTARDTAPSPMPMVGDVLENPRQIARLVQMSQRNLQFGRRSMKDKGKMGNLVTKDERLDRIEVGHMPMTKLEDWDLVDSNNSLAKMQHKLQQTLSIPNQRSQACCTCTNK